MGVCKPEQLPPDFDGLMNAELLISTGMKGKEHEKVKNRVSKDKADSFTRLLKLEWPELYYINGPETLPPPLTKEEEAVVMERVRRGREKRQGSL